jgi:hypothetical protein
MSFNVALLLGACVLALGSTAPQWTIMRIVSVDYPALAVQSHTSGLVKIECQLRDDGTVETAKLASGSELLARSIFQRIGEWKFMPRVDGSSPATPLLVLYFEFRLTEPATGPSASRFVYDYPDHFTITAAGAHRTH